MVNLPSRGGNEMLEVWRVQTLQNAGMRLVGWFRLTLRCQSVFKKNPQMEADVSNTLGFFKYIYIFFNSVTSSWNWSLLLFQFSFVGAFVRLFCSQFLDSVCRLLAAPHSALMWVRRKLDILIAKIKRWASDCRADAAMRAMFPWLQPVTPDEQWHRKTKKIKRETRLIVSVF